MQSVTVLTPHARRMVVKVDGNKTLFWVNQNISQLFFAES
jgi:hypothetical protein